MKKALVVKNLSKRYQIKTSRPLLIKEFLRPKEKKYSYALKHITFDIEKGDIVGIIGSNGSGKSTLLKLIAGISTPTTGSIKSVGKVGSMIELGAGFHPDLTGKENVYTNGALIGFDKNEMDRKMSDIVSFADIGKYIDMPARTYSSGMLARLGFSVAIHIEPDILLIDEVISVGDEEFQNKCIRKIRELVNSNVTVLCVSHDLNFIRKLCKKTYWIDKGTIKDFGETEKIIEKYINTVMTESPKKRELNKKKIYIKNVSTYTPKRQKKSTFKTNDPLLLKISVQCAAACRVKLGIRLYTSSGDYVYGHLSKQHDLKRGLNDVYYHVPKTNLLVNTYFFTVAISDPTGKIIYDWKENLAKFKIQNTVKNIYGITNLNMKLYSDKNLRK